MIEPNVNKTKKQKWTGILMGHEVDVDAYLSRINLLFEQNKNFISALDNQTSPNILC